MCHTLKCATDLTDRGNICSHIIRYCNRSQKILYIVISQQLELRKRHHISLFAILPDHNRTIFDDYTGLQFLFMAEQNHRCRNLINTLHRLRIIVIHHCIIFLRLVLRDIQLAVRIVFKCIMPVQMIRCNIEYRAHMWAECMNCLQLEATDLCNRHRIRTALIRQTCVWDSDISYDKCFVVVGFHDLANQCSRCRLSVRTCDGGYCTLLVSICKLDFTPHRNTCFFYLERKWCIDRDTRTDNHTGNICKQFISQRTKPDRQSLWFLIKPELLKNDCLCECTLRVLIKQHNLLSISKKLLTCTDSTFSCSCN